MVDHHKEKYSVPSIAPSKQDQGSKKKKNPTTSLVPHSNYPKGNAIERVESVAESDIVLYIDPKLTVQKNNAETNGTWNKSWNKLDT